MASELKRTVVIDNGSIKSRAGFAGDTNPEFVFRSVVGRPRNPKGDKTQLYYVGDEITSCKVPLTSKYPVEFSIVTNWDDMEKLWIHTLTNLLQVDTTEHALILTEPAMNPKANREKMTQIMFEKFSCPALYIGAQPALSARSAQRRTGLVVECGTGVTYTVPVYEGHVLPYAVMHLDIAGRDLTDFLCKLLDDNGYPFRTIADRELADEIKRKLCYVASDYTVEQKQTTLTRGYQTTDGKMIKVGLERIKAPEALFDPPLIGQESNGIPWYVYYSIKKVQPELRELLFENIVVSGGTTNLPGFADRLSREMKLLSPESLIGVTAPANSQHPSWHGASVLASLPEFKDICVTIDEYDEYGPSISHRRFF